MGKRAVLILAVAVMAMVILPATAFGGLINEYGMHFAGQTACTACHAGYADQLHGRFATPGLSFPAPEDWTVFRGAGDAAPVAGTAPARFSEGGWYSIAGETWLTLGDTLGNAGGEYAFFNGSTDPNVNPWNLVEGLASEQVHEYVLAEGEPAGLFDVQYGCQRCHMLGTTLPKPNATTTATVPNPAATIQPTLTTARQWARDESKTVNDFMTDPAVSYPGLGIQCEQCHGTGTTSGHWGTGASTSLAVLGQSQGCGQCHGSYTNVAGTLGISGYTTNLPMRDFVNVNGVSGGQSYTKIPTEAEFMASPTAYFMFPNGNNAKGSHYYYDEWSASAHAYRGALTATSPDAMAYQAAGNGHYNAATSSLGCAECHTGEGYLKSKDAKIAEDFTPTSSNVGFMGQECVTCHVAHPSVTGGADVVRAPDAAGERSATGLSKGNSSICEDCHNWQYEVLGTTPSYAPMADITAHGGASHPQRETLQGRSMVQVADAGEFMPGAECEQCHMPKTNKGANRFAHGMKIQLPGDAERWNTAAGASYQGEDSCSNCHPDDSRSELQAYVDEWQAEASAEAAKATAAITAAQTRTEYSLTDTTKPGYTLVGEATWNYKVFANDGSTGAHNPEYMVAGLVKAQELANSVGGSFSALEAPASVVQGGKGFVSGKAINGDGSGAAGAQLELLADGVATGDTTMANAKGTFAFAIEPAATTAYSVVWARSADAITKLTSSSVNVAIAKMSSKTTIKASASSIRVNRSVKLSGRVSPAAAGQTVKIQYRKGSGSWKTMGTVTLNASSAYAKSYKLKTKTTWSFRAKYSGTTTVAGSTSSTVKVKVK